MFQINIKLRFALMAATLVLFFVLQFTVGFGFAFIPLLVFLTLTTGYIMFGTISSTSQILNSGDFEAAEKNLKLTIKPNWLLKFYRGYYYQLLGFIAVQRKDFDGGEALLLKASELGLPTNTDKATVALQLATLNYNKKNFTKAGNYVREIKSLDVKEAVIMEQVAQLEQAMKQRPNMSQIASMQGMRGMQGRVMQVNPDAAKKSNNRKPSSKRKKK